MSRESFSISEYTILGIVWGAGPCTTYVVMRVLAGSASTFYRNRASSTYRVVQRLITAGFLEPDGDDVGARGDRRVKITEPGIQALRAWMSPPLPAVEIAHTVDLVRLRLIFLEALDPAARVAFVDDTLAALRELLSEHQSKVDQVGAAFSALGLMGGVFETRARIQWLEEVKKRLPEFAP